MFITHAYLEQNIHMCVYKYFYVLSHANTNAISAKYILDTYTNRRVNMHIGIGICKYMYMYLCAADTI